MKILGRSGGGEGAVSSVVSHDFVEKVSVVSWWGRSELVAGGRDERKVSCDVLPFGGWGVLLISGCVDEMTGGWKGICGVGC